jgi:hypothetical protein
MKSSLRLLYLFCLIFISNMAFGQIEYSLRLEADGETYCAYMRSTQTITGPQALISTAQFTILVPSAIGADRFELIKPSDNSSGIDNFQPNMDWSPSARVDAPSENSSFDYISFGFVNNVLDPSNQALFDIVAGVEYQLFCFKNGGTCQGELFIIENGVDPFIPPNSENTNPENSISIGAVGPAYSNNYNSGNKDCSTCDLNDPAADCDGDGTPNGTDCAPEDSSIYPGAVCDDGDVNTSGDAYDASCICVGGACDLNDPAADCDGDGTPNGTDCAPNDSSIYPGAVCDDGDINTSGDAYDASCICVGGACDLNDPAADCDGDGTPNGIDCAPEDSTLQILDGCGICGGDGSSCACDAEAPDSSNVRN